MYARMALRNQIITGVKYKHKTKKSPAEGRNPLTSHLPEAK
jgi:hypothetical protein